MGVYETRPEIHSGTKSGMGGRLCPLGHLTSAAAYSPLPHLKNFPREVEKGLHDSDPEIAA